MRRLVLDTNVAVSGLLWHGAPRLLLDLAREKKIKLFSSIPMLGELMDVLARAKFAPKIAASGLSILQIVEMYSELVTVVRPTPVGRVAPDPDDDVVIGTAVAAKADFLVTGDKALLSVGTFAGGRICSTSEAIQQVHADTPASRVTP